MTILHILDRKLQISYILTTEDLQVMEVLKARVFSFKLILLLLESSLISLENLDSITTCQQHKKNIFSEGNALLLSVLLSEKQLLIKYISRCDVFQEKPLATLFLYIFRR